SAGPNRRNPVSGLLASFSKWVHSARGAAWRGPASRSRTDRPRCASSLATTGPPPPAPTTMTSNIGHLPPALVVAEQIVPAVPGLAVGQEPGQLPADRAARQGARARVELRALAEAAERRELVERAAEEFEQAGHRRLERLRQPRVEQRDQL